METTHRSDVCRSIAGDGLLLLTETFDTKSDRLPRTSGDGVVDLLDFSRFKREYFEGDPSRLGTAESVPEPCTRYS